MRGRNSLPIVGWPTFSRRVRMTATAVWGALIALGVPLAQVPARPQPSQPTGLIVGRVVDAASGRPIAGAIVSLNGGAIRSGPGDPGQPRAMTSASGQFVFRKLAKGSYSLTS